MTATEIATTRRAEIQKRYEREGPNFVESPPDGSEKGVSLALPILKLREMAKELRKPQRPNRSRPINVPNNEFGAWEAASDEVWRELD